MCIRGLYKLPNGRDWLWWTGFRKSLLEFSTDAWGCAPSLFSCLVWGSPVLKSGLYGRVNADLIQEDMCLHDTAPGTVAASDPVPSAGHCWFMTLPEILRYSEAGLALVLESPLLSRGPCAHKVCLCPPSVSGMYGVWFWHTCTPLTVSLQLLLCPWVWSLSTYFFWWLLSS